MLVEVIVLISESSVLPSADAEIAGDNAGGNRADPHRFSAAAVQRRNGTGERRKKFGAGLYDFQPAADR